MKEIKLAHGRVALIDDEDFDYLNQWKWYAANLSKPPKREMYYALANIKICKKWHSFSMHRLILNVSKGYEVDHVDHNTLNNQKSNLRICCRNENMRNRIPHGKSKYLGVSFTQIKMKYKNKITIYDYIVANINTSGNHINLGTFKTELDAARAYDIAAKKYHGAFANLNFK